jgi:DNA-binding beta-propeller fold protein YncE
VSAVAVVAVAVAPALTGRLAGSPAAGHKAAAYHGKPLAFVATSGETVVPVNLTTNTAGKPIKLNVLGMPQGIAMAPDGQTVYVVSARGDVTPISTATGRQGRPIWVGGDPSTMVITPNGRQAYVADFGNGVFPVDLTTGTAGKLIKVSGATSVVMNPDGRQAYVFGAGPRRTSAAITPINVATNTTLRPIVLEGAGPIESMAVSANGTTGYVIPLSIEPGDGPAELIRVALATDRVLRPIVVGASAGTFVLAPDGKAGYAIGKASLVPVDLVTGRALKPIALPAAQMNYNFAVAPDGRLGYALGGLGHSAVPVNLVTGAALEPVNLGRPGWLSFSVTFTPNGSTVYISRYHSRGAATPGLITTLNAVTGKVGKTINTGTAPEQIVFTP